MKTVKMKNKRYPKDSKEFISQIILFIFDLLGILVSLYAGFFLSNFIFHNNSSLDSSLSLIPLYSIIPIIFLYQGIYIYRYDFWHESKLIIKSLFLSLVIILAYLAMSHEIQIYSRSAILFSFLLMMIIIPFIKHILKCSLFKMGLWKLGVKVLSNNDDLTSEIFNNPYLGYIKSRRKISDIVFLDSKNKKPEEIMKQLEEEINNKSKVMFIPLISNYQFKESDIFELTNIRTNLFILQNRINSKYRIFINFTYNYILSILILPFLLPIVGIIAWLVKSGSDGSAFFKQERLGKDGKVFLVYKFRTMYINGDEILEDYLKNNPQEIENYKIYHKYENDPRITKIGRILRKTSADELAQIFNVLKSEMNFVGPRPYMVTEREKIGKSNEDIILRLKPGITGLWQVSGRNELTFKERIDMDRWYILNWSLWTDFTILLKTIKVVLDKVGAK